jgi:O-antigen/teichoic acid export membrane protein
VGGFFASDLMSDSLRLAELDGVLQFWLLAVACYGALCFACVLLEAMLKQKQAQACMSVYLATKLFLIFLLQKWWAIDLLMLVGCEVIAALFSSVLAIMLLTRLFHHQGLRTGWLLVNENRDRLQRFAIFNYAAQCVFQLFSTDSLKLLVTRLIGLAGSASFGFSANLADMVQRYLPATLLQRLIKPVFVSRYVKSGDFGELNQMARIILKLNLLILVPVIAVVIVYGGEILALLTHGKYANGHWLFVGTLCLLIPSSHQAVLGLLASTLERNGMQFYAGLLTSVGFPIALVLIPNFGPIGAVFAAALSAVIYNTAATAYLRRAGFDYRPDFRVFCIFGILGGLMVAFLESSKSWLDGEFAQLAAMTLCVFLYLVLVRRLSVFSSAERAMMNAVLPKPIFIF